MNLKCLLVGHELKQIHTKVVECQRCKKTGEMYY